MSQPGLMTGKRGLVLGVANERSIAWGIARSLAGQGAALAFTFQGSAFERRVRPLAESIGSDLVISCDVTEEDEIDTAFATLAGDWPSIDFLVHAVAFSNKDELRGRYVDTSLENFLQSMHVSCYSFTSVARRAAAMMGEGGAMLTLSYIGAERVMPNYNVMGVAKAALEASVRYLAVDLGPQKIRVNALSAGPMRTLAGSAVANARQVYRYASDVAPLHRAVELREVGDSALYLLSDLSSAVTGTVQYVDAGFHAVGMPHPDGAITLPEE